MNGLSHRYLLDESIFIFRVRSNFSFLFYFSMNFLWASSAASHLGLFCLPMSHKKDLRIIWVNITKNPFNKIVSALFAVRNIGRDSQVLTDLIRLVLSPYIRV